MFVIAGNPDSRKYGYATCAAAILKQHLPDFNYYAISKLCDEWRVFLDTINEENNWKYTEEPLIWKELVTGGKKHLIGGLSEFYEYCSEYYGYEPDINEADLQKMISKNIEEYNEMKPILSSTRTVISFVGGAHEIVEFLLDEIIRMKCLYNKNGLEIRLFDRPEAELKKIMCNTAYAINTEGIFGNKPFVKPVKSLTTAISECDILLIFTDFKIARIQERRDQIFKRVIVEADSIAKTLNECAKRTIRIIVFNYHISNCFFANYLIQHTKSIKIKNVVVPTSYMGFKFLNVVSQRTGVKMENLSAPPIWGADEINVYIDMRAILYKGQVCKPYKRAITSKPNSTLPLGVIETELRYLSHLITEEEIIMRDFYYQEHRKTWTLRFPTIYAKVRCILDILRIWYEGDSESIISLGVCSNGTFGLPKGIVMSQPTWLKNGHFVPCDKYPVSQRTLDIVQKIGNEFKSIINEYRACQPIHSSIYMST